MDETPHQRKWRLVAERQVARDARRKAQEATQTRAARAQRRNAREADRERKRNEWLIDDHNHEMDG